MPRICLVLCAVLVLAGLVFGQQKTALSYQADASLKLTTETSTAAASSRLWGSAIRPRRCRTGLILDRHGHACTLKECCVPLGVVLS